MRIRMCGLRPTVRGVPAVLREKNTARPDWLVPRVQEGWNRMRCARSIPSRPKSGSGHPNPTATKARVADRLPFAAASAQGYFQHLEAEPWHSGSEPKMVQEQQRCIYHSGIQKTRGLNGRARSATIGALVTVTPKVAPMLRYPHVPFISPVKRGHLHRNSRPSIPRLFATTQWSTFQVGGAPRGATTLHGDPLALRHLRCLCGTGRSPRRGRNRDPKW